MRNLLQSIEPDGQSKLQAGFDKARAAFREAGLSVPCKVVDGLQAKNCGVVAIELLEAALAWTATVEKVYYDAVARTDVA